MAESLDSGDRRRPAPELAPMGPVVVPRGCTVGIREGGRGNEWRQGRRVGVKILLTDGPHCRRGIKKSWLEIRKYMRVVLELKTKGTLK